MGSVSGSSTSASDNKVTTMETGSQYTAPGSSLANPGSLAITATGAVGQGGTSVAVNNPAFGYSAADTKSLMDSMMTAQAGERQDLLSATKDILGTQQQTTSQLGGIVSATQAPTQTALSSFLPYAALGLFIWMLFKGK